MVADQRKRMTYEEQRALRDRETARKNAATAFSSQAKRHKKALSDTGDPSAVKTKASPRTYSPDEAEKAARRPPVLAIIAIAAAVVLIALVLRMCASAVTIDITVNGSPYSLHGAKTVEGAIRESGLPINPGDFISIRGTVLEKSKGHPFYATVNDEETVDPNFQLHNGDTLVIADGEDIVEEYDTTQEVTPHHASIGGAGAIHMFTPGSDGVMELRTGRISGEEVRRLISEESDAYCVKYNPEVGEDKVLALTFDEGPSEEYTADILDILKENDAHATFFCVGLEIEKYNDALVKREHDEGHLVCSGTYDHARSGDGMSVAGMDAEALADQVEHGREVISSAIGEEASRIVRLPGGELNEDMVRALDQYVDADIGWNVDTGDWTESGADEVYRVLMSLENGDIVLCHDGGGNHSGTVEALRRAVPELKKKGFSFVTVEDLMEYTSQ